MDDTQLTPLDEALELARNDTSRANYYYDVFLNTRLFIPVQRTGTSQGTWRSLKRDETFFPLYVNYFGEKAVPAFDSLERLKSWASTKSLDYLELVAHLFLQMIASDVAITLNEGTRCQHFFDSDILSQIRQAMRPVSAS